MLSTVIGLERARPWYNSDKEGSNLAKDNTVTLQKLFAHRTVALFGIPAPFTGTCTHQHYPGYQALAADLQRAGCDEIVCYTVADPYAHHGWAQSLQNNPDDITFLVDPDATFAKAYGVDRVYAECSLGQRSERFSMIVNDGIVTNFRLVEDAAADAAELLNDLKELKENIAA